MFDWKDSIGETPVLQKINKNGATGQSITYVSIKGLIVKLGYRAGYTENITFHGIRRAFLNIVNINYSTARRNQIAGYSGSMFEESYQSSISSVDGYAVMTGKAAGEDHTSILQSMAFFQYYDTPTRLSKGLKDGILKDKEYSKLVARIDELCGLLRKDPGNVGFDSERRRLYGCRLTLQRQWLREYQKTWSHQQQLQRTERTDNPVKTIRPVRDFSILRSFLPERDRLADSLFMPSYILDTCGQQTLQNFVPSGQYLKLRYIV